MRERFAIVLLVLFISVNVYAGEGNYSISNPFPPEKQGIIENISTICDSAGMNALKANAEQMLLNLNISLNKSREFSYTEKVFFSNRILQCLTGNAGQHTESDQTTTTSEDTPKEFPVEKNSKCDFSLLNIDSASTAAEDIPLEKGKYFLNFYRLKRNNCFLSPAGSTTSDSTSSQ